MKKFIIAQIDDTHIGDVLDPVLISTDLFWVCQRPSANFHVWFVEGGETENVTGRVLPINHLDNFTYCGEFLYKDRVGQFYATEEAPTVLIHAFEKQNIKKHNMDKKPARVEEIEKRALIPRAEPAPLLIDLLIFIQGKLLIADQARAAQVNKAWHSASKRLNIWVENFKRHFPLEYNGLQLTQLDWKVEFKKRKKHEDKYNSVGYALQLNGLMRLMRDGRQKELRAKILELSITDLSFLNSTNMNLTYWLHHFGHYSLLNELFQTKILPDYRGNLNRVSFSHQNTLLHWACAMRQNKDYITTLLKGGAIVDSQDSDKRTPLFYACINGIIEIVELLLNAGANVNALNDLFTACQHGHLRVVRLLLNAGVNVNAANNHGYTALLLACMNGHLEIVRLLLEYKANMDATIMFSGATVLAIACANGRHDMAKLFIIKDLEQYIEINTAVIEGSPSSPQFQIRSHTFFEKTGINIEPKIKAAQALLMVIKGEQTAEILKDHIDSFKLCTELAKFYNYSLEHNFLTEIHSNQNAPG